MSVWERLVRWWNNDDLVDYWSDQWWKEHKVVFDQQKTVADLSSRLEEAHERNINLAILLECAPMVDVIRENNPTEQSARLAALRSPFVYIHPKTFEKHIQRYGHTDDMGNFFILGSRTKYVQTLLMPMDRMLLSPRPLIRQKSNG